MIKIQNPEYQTRIKEYMKRNRFMDYVGFDLNVIKPGLTEGIMDIEEKHLQQTGLIHGGLIATVADIVAGFAAFTTVTKDQYVVTGEIKISYFRPGKGERLYAKGWVIKSGRKINFCEAEVYAETSGERVLIAKATASMVITEGKK